MHPNLRHAMQTTSQRFIGELCVDKSPFVEGVAVVGVGNERDLTILNGESTISRATTS